MSAATATLIAGGLAIIGTLLGLVTERVLRSWGRLQCETSEWRLSVPDPRTGENLNKGPGPGLTEPASLAVYSFAVDLFNGREVPTGLRDIAVEIVRDDGERIRDRPLDRATYKGEMRARRYDTLDVLNLPPRQYVHKELEGSFDQEGASALQPGRWRRVEFVGELPKRDLLGRKTYRKVVATP